MPTVAIDARDARAAELRGWGRYAGELLAALERRAPAAGIRVLPLAGDVGPEALWEQVALPRLLRRHGADAVHMPNCFLPLRRACPGVVTIHDLAFEEYPEDFARTTRAKYRALAPRAAHSAERVICVSETTAADVRSRYGIDPGKIRVIHSAPALPLGTREPPPGPYVLAVGDLRRKKNFVALAKAFRLLWADGLPHRLVIAGMDTGEGERIRAAAGPAPVDLPGYVADDRLDALMRGADVLVHPSLYEGFGLVLVEAMARGVPVAAARASALPETAGDAAEWFDPHDFRDLARALRLVLEDAARRDTLVERGRARASEFSWDRTADHTLAVYREVLA